MRGKLCARQESFLNRAQHTVFQKMPRQEMHLQQEGVWHMSSVEQSSSVVGTSSKQRMEMILMPVNWVAVVG